MLLRRPSAEARRRKLLRTVAPGPLHDYLASALPSPDTPAEQLRLLSVDLETTGMDPRRDRVLSVGFVPVEQLRVVLRGARRFVVRAEAEVGPSAVIHGITDDALATGVPLETALASVLAALRGRVLLSHFTDIEERFLSAACKDQFGAEMPCVRVDTLELQRRILLGRFHGEAPPGTLRLWQARQRYGLPVYRAHDALVDALGCAELFLAQVAELASQGPVTFRRLAS